ncbi:Metallo-dependent phosphatase-like protein [Ilyonectria robusta]|uniref:Metallo-dependent phosphatase-like protein n=1 Tax=Ilyonectria robusta TaxID=1079257 RepID=UPI001E8D519F|nr:Metallo-dependent phosphatase-like protein [Ilyonectria robusta]KAH8685228.1 Metallo-dependent phosphatase-like protein [Ilyonectria robusta]
MKTSHSLVALALAASACAEDVLYSKRLTKRFIDDDGNYNMSFFHVNDVHAHLDEYRSSGSDCTDPTRGCYGGYARLKHTVDGLRKEHPDNLWLNAGDEFQGTLFYSYYKGEKIAEVLNTLEFDAMTLGNHEWDGGDEQLGEFLLNLTFPVVSCNVKSEYAGLNKTIKNYHIFEEHNLAVIGVTTDTTPGISSVGEKTTFLDPIEEVQKSIWEIRNTTEIKRIVALTHIGYDVDQELAAQTEGLSLIIGGHSHTLLGDMDDAEGDYPTIVEDVNGDEVFIVTAYRWGEYFGSIDITFDEDGKALAYHGAPIHMDNSTEMDAGLNKTIKAWRGPFEKFAAVVVGNTKVELDQTTCQDGDCLLGQVMADAMYDYRFADAPESSKPDFAFINAGGVRATIDAGNITRGEVLTSFPFGNAIVELTYTGAELSKIFEGAVAGINLSNDEEITSWFQVSKTLNIAYNPDNNNGSKIINMTIDGEAVKDDQEYRMITLDFLAGGGDNFLEVTTDFITLDTQDEVLIGYLEDNNPLDVKLEKRVVTTDQQAADNSSSSNNSSSDSSDSGSSGSGGSGGSAASITQASLYAAMIGTTIALALM